MEGHRGAWRLQSLLRTSKGSWLPGLTVSPGSFSAPGHAQSLSLYVRSGSIAGRLIRSLMYTGSVLKGQTGEENWEGGVVRKGGELTGIPWLRPQEGMLTVISYRQLTHGLILCL